jgi:hypothetical protein
MAANKGMVAGSHNRNEFVMIRHDGDAPVPVRSPNPMPPSLLPSDSVPASGSGILDRGVSFSVTLGCGRFSVSLLVDFACPFQRCFPKPPIGRVLLPIPELFVLGPILRTVAKSAIGNARHVSLYRRSSEMEPRIV